MKKIDVYNIEGKKVADVELHDAVFALGRNDALLHQVYVAQAANRRRGSAHTKIRSEVRGGGRKPWKQKGTGNARTGSIRNPIWRGGGTIFGPLKQNNYRKDINIKMKKQALLTALSDKVRAGKLYVVESLQLDEKKTKKMAALLDGLDLHKTVLMGFSAAEAGNHIAARNVANVATIETEKLNVYDVLNAEYLVVSTDSIAQMEQKYTA
ncbi:MAG: 50S ribosomal protein L4 [Candidatus Moraniibacteriota bacterium]|nr:MAG: 50S ribosomal protein L4 [Candidatus Moranbacteria bacterium]